MKKVTLQTGVVTLKDKNTIIVYSKNEYSRIKEERINNLKSYKVVFFLGLIIITVLVFNFIKLIG